MDINAVLLQFPTTRFILLKITFAIEQPHRIDALDIHTR